MSKLEILTFLHILGAFLIVAGASVGAATGIAMTRTTSVRAIGLLARISRRAELMAIVPGALIAIVFGTWLVVDLDAYDFNEPWISAAYVLWFVAIGLGTGVLGPLMRRIASAPISCRRREWRRARSCARSPVRRGARSRAPLCT